MRLVQTTVVLVISLQPEVEQDDITCYDVSEQRVLQRSDTMIYHSAEADESDLI